MCRIISSVRDFLATHSRINWTLGDQALVSGVNFVTGILLARFLGLEEFGRFTLAWTAVLLTNSVQFALVSAPVMSIEPIHGEGERSAYYGAALSQQIVVAGLSFVVLWLGVRLSGVAFPEWHAEGLALPLACAASGFQMQDFLRRYLFTRGRPAAAFANDALRYLGQLGLLIWLLSVAKLDANHVLWLIAATAGAGTAAGVAIMGPFEWRPRSVRAVARRHWTFAKWLLLSSQLQQFATYPLIWALGFLVGSEAVGVLFAARNILGVLHILYLGLGNFVRPSAAQHLESQGVVGVARFLRRFMSALALPVGLICLSVALFPGPIASVFYGDLLVGNEFVVMVFSLWYFIHYLAQPFTYFLITLGETRRLAAANGPPAAISAALCIPIVYYSGLYGVLVSFIVLSLLRTLLLYRNADRLYRLRESRDAGSARNPEQRWG